MLKTEFLRNLNCNYERIALDASPEERRYQYCIVCRGGVKGLLSCSLRYINGQSYLYYDITSKQNIAQLYCVKPLTRKWVKDFFWSLRRVREELARFLLDERNVIWMPEQVFQDLENNSFFYLYMPYYEADNGFGKLLEFMVEHIDYDDMKLVECVYNMYEQFEKKGWDYLRQQIYNDAEKLNIVQETEDMVKAMDADKSYQQETELIEKQYEKETVEDICKKKELEDFEKKGLFTAWKNRRKKEKEERESYHENMLSIMEGYAVAEENEYEEEWGRTIYIEETPIAEVPSLYTTEGRKLAVIDKDMLTIGKKREDAEVVLEDISVSRLHARILREGDKYYLEDLNSTNGTFKNGLRMEPYEKRGLDPGDEIKIGKKELIFR